MDKNAIWKWLILVALLALSAASVTQGIRLGLDLKGGTSFTVRINEKDVAAAVRERDPSLTPEQVDKDVRQVLLGAQGQALEVIRNRVDKLGIDEPIIYPGKGNRIIVQLPGASEEKRQQAEQMLRSVAFLEFRMVHEKNDELVGKLFDQDRAPEGYRIVTIGDSSYYKPDESIKASALDPAYRERLGRFEVPSPGFEFMLEAMDVQNQTLYKPVFVNRRRELTGEYIDKAWVDIRATAESVVKLKFNRKGAKKFASITADYAPGGARNSNPNQHRQLAIVLDGTLYSAPVIREAIFGGQAEITGRFTRQEANRLATVLSAGSLPAPVEIVEKRFISPSLGADSIRSGVRAAVVGGVGVVLFMAIYYLVAGLVADMALILNLLLLPIGMIATAGFLGIFAGGGAGGSMIQLPVLTMPGIAGIALTFGMAVDANVLIFERIREEAKAGKRLWTAITAGYDRAFLAILDSNLTTVLSGIILFIFGSGPLRGFAVTLIAGLLVSMFTALTCTKLIFGLLATRTKLQNLRMLSMLKETSIDFIAKQKPAALLSLAVIVVTWGIMTARGIQNPSAILGVDFLGGASLTVAFAEKQPLDKIRESLEQRQIKDASIQYQKEIEQGGRELLNIKVGPGAAADATKPEAKTQAEVVKAALAEDFPDAGFTVEQEDDVGPQVGKEMKTRAVWALGLSLVSMAVYLAWRFEMGFALGAIVALLHDVLVTVGVFSLLGRQMSLTLVAALLTIVGYSVNDTIVIFDRIREDLKLVRNKTFREICNLSVNQTLGRTILTTLVTLISVLALLVLGGGAINDFALALFIGMVAGTYSTVYVATPVVLAWHHGKRPEFAAKPTP